MNIRQALLQENSKKQAQRIAAYINGHEERFELLMQLFLHEDDPLTQRASWVVSHCADAQPNLLEPYLEAMLQNLRKPKLHDAVKRNTVRILQNVNIPENLLGEAAEICFQYLTDPKEAAAIRVFSMTVVFNICKKVPELMPELQLTIEEFLPYGTAGFKSRGKKTLAAIQKWRDNKKKPST